MAYNNINMEQKNPNGYGQENPTYGWKPTSPGSQQPPPPPPPGAVPFVDPETLDVKNMSFSEESIRKGFIRKVYLILMAQLTFTFGIIAVFVLHEPTHKFVRENDGIVIGAAVTTFVIIIAMACCENTRRTFPTNFICLAIFTAAESVLVGAIAGFYEVSAVLMAFGITAIICLALTLFAMQTKYDFTACGGFLVAMLVCLLIFGIVGIFWRSHIVDTVYAGLGALLACMFLIYDTQLMMGGSHKYQISPEEYIFAALNLYMDVIRIFLFILRLLGNKK